MRTGTRSRRFIDGVTSMTRTALVATAALLLFGCAAQDIPCPSLDSSQQPRKNAGHPALGSTLGLPEGLGNRQLRYHKYGRECDAKYLIAI
jgi:hypothetical protein